MIINIGLAGHFGYFCLQLDHFQLENQLIPWTHNPAETYLVQTGEIDQPVTDILRGRKIGKYTADLGHTLKNQDTGHNRFAREMALKIRLTHGYILQPGYGLTFLNIKNSINHDKGISVW